MTGEVTENPIRWMKQKNSERGKVLSESPSKGLSFDAGPLKEEVSTLSIQFCSLNYLKNIFV